jgi:hypothetical protein
VVAVWQHRQIDGGQVIEIDTRWRHSYVLSVTPVADAFAGATPCTDLAPKQHCGSPEQ